ncbi:MAG: membrane protein insertase YidC [Bauldia sp.]|nr:membrane protein insertase YidC [Bauldia sp.]MCB1496654.1 membrane protein insertase YidC [Bauldia sp.]
MDNKNFLIAIALSIAVLIGWQYFIAGPQIEKARQQQQLEQQVAADQKAAGTPPAATGEGAAPGVPETPGAASGAVPQDKASGGALTRDQALAESSRVPIATERVSGSINLRGGRIDDVRLNDFHETVDKSSPTIILLSPADGPDGYFAEFGWIGDNAPGALPGPDTIWEVPAGATLSEATPVTLTYDNGQGLVFKRTISIDEYYMFTVTETVTNNGAAPVTMSPYGRVTRLGEPNISGYFILHEGLIGVFGDQGLEEVDYKDLKDAPPMTMEPTKRGWLGITDKYWAATLVPPADQDFTGRFLRSVDPSPRYQADFSSAPLTVQPGSTAESTSRLFAGAKQVSVVDGYQTTYDIESFELLIDWGWFYFITKPMFFLIDFLYRMLGNFGVAILAVTVIVKALFFPLANKSYKSMSAMKKVQPQMAALREQYKDDKVKQQQALMELYKKEKINPLAGCWPIAIQIPVFFSLYKVLFVTIEMRHAPFFGWIQDLSAPDPTTIFNLFGLIPWTPPHFLMLGVWPLLMGISMFVQMRLNPTPPDPAQRMIFTWMPLIFMFMLAGFPAGLVIYWAWNNTLSVAQQYFIMRRQGVDVNLLGNILESIGLKKGSSGDGTGGAPPKTSAAKSIAAPKPANDSEAPAKAAPAKAAGPKKKAAPKAKSASKRGKSTGKPTRPAEA